MLPGWLKLRRYRWPVSFGRGREESTVPMTNLLALPVRASAADVGSAPIGLICGSVGWEAELDGLRTQGLQA